MFTQASTTCLLDVWGNVHEIRSIMHARALTHTHTCVRGHNILSVSLSLSICIYLSNSISLCLPIYLVANVWVSAFLSLSSDCIFSWSLSPHIPGIHLLQPCSNSLVRCPLQQVCSSEIGDRVRAVQPLLLANISHTVLLMSLNIIMMFTGLKVQKAGEKSSSWTGLGSWS